MFFPEGEKKKSANVGDIEKVVFRTVFGIDACHGLHGAAVQEFHSDVEMFFLEKIDQLLRIFPVHGRIPNELAFFACAFDEFLLTLRSRQAIYLIKQPFDASAGLGRT